MQKLQQIGRQHHIAIGAPLALLDTDQHPGGVDVADLEVGDLRNAQAAAIGDAEDGFVLQLARAMQQQRHLLGAEHLGKTAFSANRRQLIPDA